jgi:hypothetical protein
MIFKMKNDVSNPFCPYNNPFFLPDCGFSSLLVFRAIQYTIHVYITVYCNVVYRPGISENPPLKNQNVSHIVCQGGAV